MWVSQLYIHLNDSDYLVNVEHLLTSQFYVVAISLLDISPAFCEMERLLHSVE